MNHMKKIAVLGLALVMAGTMAACGVGDVGGVSSSSKGAATSSQTSSAASSQADESSFDNSLDGLAKYLTARSLISGSPTDMKAEFIGAKKGVKYQFGLNGNNNVTVELYELPDTLNATAQKVVSDVKSKGGFTIMSQQVPGVLSDSGKYLMIYKDTTTNNDQNKKRQEDTVSAFKSFKKS